MLGISACLAGGCGRPQAGQAGRVSATVEGGGAFPRSLAGRWKASQDGWEIEIGPDGRISSAIISFGRVRVIPGRTTTVPTKSGSQGVFTPGPWTVHYDPGTRELTVRITMEHVRVEMAGNVVEGSSTDVFVGPIAASGRTWQAQWTAFTRYVARAPDHTSGNLSTDPTNGETRSLIFEKVTDRPSP